MRSVAPQALLAAVVTLVSAGRASAAETPPPGGSGTVSELVVTSDQAGLLERRPSDTVLGLNKPLIDTPRSASFVSDVTLERYGIQTLDKLTAVSPGTYTASYYGVPGSLNVRGGLAENYFRGFKRIEDRGTYSTPIGDASRIEIVRGPPSPLYGPGKVGGMLNFVPKTARDSGAFITRPTLEFTVTGGSYDRRNATVQAGAPADFGSVRGGVYAYGELEDSHSYYRGVFPRRQLGEVSADFDVGSGWSLAFGGMVFHSTGDVQTPGWNRLTQDLVDHRTYITGHNTTLVDANHDGRLEPTEISPGGVYPFTTALYTPYFGFPPATDPRFVLDTGLGTTTLDRRTVFVSALDFSKTWTQTYYADAIKDLGQGRMLKLQGFFDNLSNQRFVSYGFPADYHAWTWELRATFSFDLGAGDAVSAHSFVGASYRRYGGERKETFDSGLISLDRRDLSAGPTATDVFDAPFFNSPGGLGWETDIHSRWRDAGVFATTDIKLGRLNLILGGRYDDFSAASRDTGIFSFETPDLVHAGKGRFTWSAGATYHLPWGLMPYLTYARGAALEVGQAGDLKPADLQSGAFLSASELAEGGVKVQQFGGALVGSLAVYRQQRTQLSGLNGIAQPTVGKGFEYELRWVASRNLSFTLAGDLQHTEVVGPDHSIVYLPAAAVGVSPANGFGGAFLTFDFSTLPGRAGNYAYALIPHAAVSVFGAYTSDLHPWGRVGATLGVSWASKTSGLIQDAVTYPAYAVANLSLMYANGPWEADLNVDNLTDAFYLTPDQDVLANVGAVPGRGREWRLTVKRRF